MGSSAPYIRPVESWRRYNGRNIGFHGHDVLNHTVFVNYKSGPLRIAGNLLASHNSPGYSISEPVLDTIINESVSKLFIVDTKSNDVYLYQREQYERGEYYIHGDNDEISNNEHQYAPPKDDYEAKWPDARYDILADNPHIPPRSPQKPHP